MKNRNTLMLILIYMLMVSLVLVGCNGAKEKVDEAINPPAQDTQTSEEVTKTKDTSTDVQVSDELKIRANEEGVSVKEMQAMIDELTAMTAEKYGSTKEEYIKMLEADGKTPFNEFVTAADYMGISIKEYYDYEKQNTGNMTEEQKETMQGMNEAMKELQNLDTTEFEAQANEAMNMLQGMQGAGDREVTGDYKALGKFKVDEVIKESEDTEAGVYEITYNCTAKCDDIVAYFVKLLEGTPNYMIIQYPGVQGANITGTINGNQVAVIIDNEDGDDVTKVTYGYIGK